MQRKNCIKLEYYIVCGPSKLKWLGQKYILSRSTGNVYICSIKLCNLKEHNVKALGLRKLLLSICYILKLTTKINFKLCVLYQTGKHRH